jgi:hypothetical protein
MNLDALAPGATLRGLVPDAAVTVVSVQRHGVDALTLTYRDPAGRVAEEILYRHDEPRLSLVEVGRLLRMQRGWVLPFSLVRRTGASRPT